MEKKMKLFTCLFFSFALLFSFSGSYADWQSETGNNNDSSQNDMGDFDNWDLPPDIHIVSFSNPTIDVQWGMLTKVQANDIGLLDIGSADLRIGFTEKKFDSRHEDILDYSHNFMYLSNSSNSWLTSPNSDDKRVETSAWSFGFGTSGGYGYKLGGDADLSLYHMNGIGWTKTEFKDSTIDRAANDLIRTLGDNFRFGTMFEAGMKLQVFKPIALNVAYERSIVFPRHMFWYWAASEITEGIGQAF
jgi:opacity protein-like surface antigen